MPLNHVATQGDSGPVAYLQCGSGWRLEREESLAEEALLLEGVPVVRMPLSRMQRGRLVAGSMGLAVGGLPFIKAALRLTDAMLPPDECYPEALHHFLGRRIRRSTLARELERMESTGRPVFLKPAIRTKRFTGFVASPGEGWRTQGAPGHEPVWCSETICLQSEWRAYVIGREIAFLAFCDGTRNSEPDRGRIQEMVKALADSRRLPLACAIDVGMTPDGSTVLVEVNDGYSLGAYNDIPSGIYLALLRARWFQLCGDTGRDLD